MMVTMSGDRSQLFLLFFSVAIFYLLQQKITAADDVIACKGSERQALLDFKHSLRVVHESGHGNLSSWYGENCCAWSGVHCNSHTGYVEKLDLHGHWWHVAGTISPSLLELQHLRYLDLSENDFNGSHIPEFIGSLQNLRHLHLSSANFRGPIPSQLGNLSKLETLYLGDEVIFPDDYFDWESHNKIPNFLSVENLKWLSHLSCLKKLDLSFNNLSKASDWSQVISQLPSLEKLAMNDCDLPSAFSSSLSFVNSSATLTHLYLPGNNLTFSAINPWLFNVSSNLVELDLSRNQLKGQIPESFGTMVNMGSLNLSYNLLDGGIYRSFWSMCGLTELYMEYNHLSAFGFVQNTSSCKGDSLEVLSLVENQLTGSVLNEMANLSSLEVLDLGYNLLNGTISESVGKLSKLEVLRLAGNSFENVVISKAHVSNFTRLKGLDLSYSSLTLKFSSGWNPPFSLVALLLRSCKLGPRFPYWLQNQTSISVLDISDAKISDSLPFWFWDTFNRVYYLNLSSNQVNGTLPNAFSKPFYVPWSLSLSKNKFFGSISSICSFTDDRGFLNLLDLSNNQFSGALPNCFSHFPNLIALNLADNNLSGPIPSSFGSLASLEMLSLRGNRFSGGLTSTLQHCVKLKFLDFSDNTLSGKIPFWIGQSLSSLVFLSLQSNQFKGKIPYQLCRLKYIQILDLSVNKISGTIPGCFSNFTSMIQEVNMDHKTIEHFFTLELVPSIVFDGNPLELNYVGEALLVWKGTKQMYANILGLLLVIDLSCNKLIGEIPQEITRLQELVALNLSKNFLIGEIPQKIGQLRQLNSLDLSRNKISGSIPPSMSELTFLGILDLSYNHLSGKIPTGTQLQSFNTSVFSHNDGLCGPPVTPNCSGSVETPQSQQQRGQDDYEEFMKWFYTGMGIGFAVGFWGFCSAFLLKRSWRHSYFRLLDKVKDWLYVTYALQKARLMRKFKS